MRVFNVNLINALLLLSSSILSIHTSAYAAKIHHSSGRDNAWFVGLGGGVSWIGLSNSTTVNNGSGFPPPSNQDTFSINSLSTGVAQINAGYVTHSAKTFFPSLSTFVQYRHYFEANITGNIDEYSLPEFKNYNYNISYEADLFTINGKAGLVQLQKVIPYLSGGIGFIINHLNDYSESPKPGVTPRISPAYQGKSDMQLALTLGAGLDFIINKCMTATLGYDHVFQGNIKSGSGVSTWSNTALNFGNTKMDTVFINITTNFPEP